MDVPQKNMCVLVDGVKFAVRKQTFVKDKEKREKNCSC